MMKRSWRKLATLVSAFMSGTKGLYKDVREMYELKKRQRLVVTGMAPQKTGSDTTDFGFTRSEYQFIYQVINKEQNYKIIASSNNYFGQLCY